MGSLNYDARLAATVLSGVAVAVVLRKFRQQLKEAAATGVDPTEALRGLNDLVATRNAVVHGSTASSLLVQSTPPVSETVVDALIRTQDAYTERTRTHTQHSSAVEDHQTTYLKEWQQRVKIHSQRSPEDMLTSLWNSGLSWRDIARILKVSVAAVQKWRSGEKMTAKNFARLRDFIAAYDLIAAHRPGVDIATWLDVPILSDVPITPQHLWSDSDHETFFEFALGDLKPEDALDALDPEWRRRYREDGFEFFVGSDGAVGVRMKDR